MTHAVLLGVAQDAGRPQPGCARPCCREVRDPGLPVSVALVHGDDFWLLDVTPAINQQLALLPGKQLRGVVLTHAHTGHYTGLVALGKEAMDAQIPVWCMPRMRDFLSANRPWSRLVERGNALLRPLEHGADLGPFRVSGWPVPHRDEDSETVAVHVQAARSLLYLPDIDAWGPWALGLDRALDQVDVALLDGTFWDDHELDRDMSEIPHPRIAHTLPLLGANADKVHFVHLNHSNPVWDPASDQAAQVRRAGAHVATRGQVFPLGS